MGFGMSPISKKKKCLYKNILSNPEWKLIIAGEFSLRKISILTNIFETELD